MASPPAGYVVGSPCYGTPGSHVLVCTGGQWGDPAASKYYSGPPEWTPCVMLPQWDDVCFANGADNNVHTVFGLPGGTKYDTQPLVCAYCSLPIW